MKKHSVILDEEETRPSRNQSITSEYYKLESLKRARRRVVRGMKTYSKSAEKICHESQDRNHVVELVRYMVTSCRSDYPYPAMLGVQSPYYLIYGPEHDTVTNFEAFTKFEEGCKRRYATYYETLGEKRDHIQAKFAKTEDCRIAVIGSLKKFSQTEEEEFAEFEKHAKILRSDLKRYKMPSMVCPIPKCPASFDYIDKLLVHVDEEHGYMELSSMESKHRFRCKYCEKIYVKKEAYLEHLKSNHKLFFWHFKDPNSFN